MSVENAAEVLIVGAGPTGLSLAITLRRWGIPVRIVDRAAEPSPVSKALALWSASLEALQGMGVVDKFVAEGQRLNALCVGEGDRRLATLAVGEGIDSAFPFPLLLPQSRTEALLTERLSRTGGRHRAQCRTGRTGPRCLRRHRQPAPCRRHHRERQDKYLAGCDGARSAVRQALEIVFEGYTEPQTFLLADVKIAGGDLDHRSIYLWWHNGGTVAMFPFGQESGASSPCAARNRRKATRRRPSRRCSVASTVTARAASTSTIQAGCRSFASTSGWRRITGSAAVSWRATPPTSIRRPVGRA